MVTVKIGPRHSARPDPRLSSLPQARTPHSACALPSKRASPISTKKPIGPGEVPGNWCAITFRQARPSTLALHPQHLVIGSNQNTPYSTATSSSKPAAPRTRHQRLQDANPSRRDLPHEPPSTTPAMRQINVIHCGCMRFATSTGIPHPPLRQADAAGLHERLSRRRKAWASACSRHRERGRHYLVGRR